MASVSRTLVISSKEQLYKLIDFKEDLQENKLFIPFMDSMYNHYYGCRCDADLFNSQSNEQFDKLNNQEVIDFLKEYFNCNVTFLK